ncbi:ATPase, T2SS/T4P/T4SS family [Pseudomonas sp. Marseille-Q5115]|uniref:ATPase, T2SS/T4P/T4SS family n=1 Tax=Pseudomonas sp. Marseille-Q5115 TaxID=2866593 RepID=UPI001CE3ED58|nr:ATPase, T2SS/T4P/T4SS family [Pseudomonas sp. Marseille-Q5115]
MERVNENGFTSRELEVTRHNMAHLTPYLDADDVFEIRINKFGQVVCDTVNGRRIEDDPNLTETYLKGLCEHLLSLNRLPWKPINYLVLPDGSRGTFCWNPAVVGGTVLIAIRKHLQINKSLRTLAQEGRFSRVQIRKFSDHFELRPWENELLQLLDRGDIDEFLEKAVLNKLNIAVAGATGSGKTLLTRSLLSAVPAYERVILLEDSHEVTNHHLLEVGYMLYGSDGGRVSASECLKACMRLTPDRVFLTELRDDAAWEYLTSANTGNPGGIFSTHSDSALETFDRVADLVKSSPTGQGLDYGLIMRKVRSALDCVVYMEKRDVVEILYDPLAKRKALYAA